MTVIADARFGRSIEERAVLEEFVGLGSTVTLWSGGKFKSVTYPTYAEALGVYMHAVSYMADRERKR